jgi:hypothetical protein
MKGGLELVRSCVLSYRHHFPFSLHEVGMAQAFALNYISASTPRLSSSVFFFLNLQYGFLILLWVVTSFA